MRTGAWIGIERDRGSLNKLEISLCNPRCMLLEASLFMNINKFIKHQHKLISVFLSGYSKYTIMHGWLGYRRLLSLYNKLLWLSRLKLKIIWPLWAKRLIISKTGLIKSFKSIVKPRRIQFLNSANNQQNQYIKQKGKSK